MTDLMDLELLRTFVAVARGGSVNLAANELHMSQASVSRHIQRLEAAIGADLFVRRGGRALVLTVSGRRILEPSVQLLEDAGRQWGRLRMLAGNAGRRLVVGFGPGIALLPEVTDAIARFGAQHPEIEAQLVEHGNSATALRELLDGKLDIAVTALRDSDVSDEIEAVPIVPLRLRALVRNGHRLADREQVTLTELAGETFAFLEGSDGLNLFTEICTSADVLPRVAHRCEQMTTLMTLLAAGDVITVLLAGSGPVPGPFTERFRMIPVDAEHPRVSMSVFWNRTRPPVAVVEDFVRLARAVASARGTALIQD
jgi:DNA-binding transcriptional LysR family regulator